MKSLNTHAEIPAVRLFATVSYPFPAGVERISTDRFTRSTPANPAPGDLVYDCAGAFIRVWNAGPAAVTMTTMSSFPHTIPLITVVRAPTGSALLLGALVFQRVQQSFADVI